MRTSGSRECELVVVFRGTQGDDLLGEGYADVITDIEYIVRKKPVHQDYLNPRGDRYDLYMIGKKEHGINQINSNRQKSW